jgi:hypothetical protein
MAGLLGGWATGLSYYCAHPIFKFSSRKLSGQIFKLYPLNCTVVTKEQIKQEIDKIPENLLEEVFAWLKRITRRSKRLTWMEWPANLGEFSPDFMNNRNQSPDQVRDSLD